MKKIFFRSTSSTCQTSNLFSQKMEENSERKYLIMFTGILLHPIPIWTTHIGNHRGSRVCSWISETHCSRWRTVYYLRTMNWIRSCITIRCRKTQNANIDRSRFLIDILWALWMQDKLHLTLLLVPFVQWQSLQRIFVRYAPKEMAPERMEPAVTPNAIFSDTYSRYNPNKRVVSY